MRVTAFTKYDREAASTRQRLLQYVPFLERAGFQIDYRPLLGSDYVRNLASGGGFSRAAVARAYLRRMRELLSRDVGDIIWVYGELFPHLPASFETLALRTGRPVVYDFDDAFFHQYDQHPNQMVRRLLGKKFEALISGAAACACGNAYLQDFASRHCEHNIVLPTVVDTELYRPSERPWTSDEPVVIGWIGSPSTFRHLSLLMPLLRELAEAHRVRFRIVGAGHAASAYAFPGMEMIEWSEAGEVACVQQMQIGIMPLPDEPWAQGKSGYKLIQYMACGIPVVASPVGVNVSIVTPGENGFLARDLNEWRNALTALIEQPELRLRMGEAGRARAVQAFSVSAHAHRFADLLRGAASGFNGHEYPVAPRPFRHHSETIV